VIVQNRLLTLLLAGTMAFPAGCTPTASGGRDSGNSARVAAEAPSPRLVWKTLGTDQTKAHVEMTGIDPIALAVLGNPEVTREEWSSFLAVHVVTKAQRAPATKPPPLLGSYTATKDGIRFEPRFPLEPEMTFRAEFDPVQMHAIAQKHLVLCSASGADWENKFTTKLAADFSTPPRVIAAQTKIVEVSPTASVLPENLLRFYIHFSAPMSRGEAYARIQLLDAKGEVVRDPFLELTEELWSYDGARFTLLFDPGRIKRGLKPREEVGPVLESGKAYTLVIDRDWPDADGSPLQAGFRKSFRAGPPDETSPDPKTWTIKPPLAGTPKSLEVRFPEPLDRALLDRLIAVTDNAGKVLAGSIATSDGETAWEFTPQEPWRAGDYRLRIGTDLEDVAGNSVARPFEVDIAGPVTTRVVSESVTVPFRIAGPAR
jgi:hypothetical protein